MGHYFPPCCRRARSGVRSTTRSVYGPGWRSSCGTARWSRSIRRTSESDWVAGRIIRSASGTSHAGQKGAGILDLDPVIEEGDADGCAALRVVGMDGGVDDDLAQYGERDAPDVLALDPGQE